MNVIGPEEHLCLLLCQIRLWLKSWKGQLFVVKGPFSLKRDAGATDSDEDGFSLPLFSLHTLLFPSLLFLFPMSSPRPAFSVSLCTF